MYLLSPRTNGFGGVAGVYYEGGMLRDPIIVVLGVVGGDYHHVGRGEGLFSEGAAFNGRLVLGYLERGDVGIVVGHLGAFLTQEVDDVYSGGLAHVLHVALVGDAEDEDAAAAQGLGVVIQRIGHEIEDVDGHLGVDLGGKLDEAGLVV